MALPARHWPCVHGKVGKISSQSGHVIIKIQIICFFLSFYVFSFVHFSFLLGISHRQWNAQFVNSLMSVTNASIQMHQTSNTQNISLSRVFLCLSQLLLPSSQRKPLYWLLAQSYEWSHVLRLKINMNNEQEQAASSRNVKQGRHFGKEFNRCSKGYT